MISQKTIRVEITSLSSLQGVVETYKEIAATRVTRTKNSVQKSHNFLAEINGIFAQVKSSYREDLMQIVKQKKLKDASKLSFLKTNGRTVYVLLSANTGLYGDVIKRTFEAFRPAAVRAKDEGSHLAIVGKLGLFLLRESGLPDPYRYFNFPDQKVDDVRLHEIVTFLIQYEKIVIFYPEFKSVVEQNPAISDISGNLLPEELTSPDGVQKEAVREVKYLFEPSLEKVLEFFETEIFSSIFEQTIRDSQLAKFASRLVSLDVASQNIKRRLDRIVFDAQRLRHREKNKKQNQMFASMRLWR